MTTDYLYYPFTPSGLFTGTQGTPVSSNASVSVSGNLGQPGDCMKLAAGSDPWNSAPVTLPLLGGALLIASLTEADWTDALRLQWVTDYLHYCGTDELASDAYVLAFVSYAENQDIFQALSGACVAYADKDLDTEVVSLGLAAYPLDMVRAYAGSASNTVRGIIFSQHMNRVPLVSNACKVTYRGVTHVVWAFGGIEHAYSLDSGAPGLRTGGGNVFAQVQLGGLSTRASYVVKARVDPDDPTMGLYSGVSEPLFTNEEIVLIDTSVWTEDSASDWTWRGDFTRLPIRWRLADITNPGVDYAGLSVDYMQFPVSVLRDIPVGKLG